MGKTLFWYIFGDLIKVFLLTSGAIAGIMSFGGLLRPLTEHGLDVLQMSQMLTYFMPAMMNYSWPVAALFATTFVYGRLAADNELTAARAVGISYMALFAPVAILGVTLSLASLAMMLYVVPVSLQRAEGVIYSNLARLVANEIERHQLLRLDRVEGDVTVSARSARVLPPDPNRPGLQAVRLDSVSIAYLGRAGDRARFVREHNLARAATIFFESGGPDGGELMLSGRLEGGMRIPRDPTQPNLALDSQEIRPVPLRSPVRETARFMSIERLLHIREHPEESRRVLHQLSSIRRANQQRELMRVIAAELNRDGRTDMDGPDGTHTVVCPTPASVRGDGVLVLTAGTPEQPGLQFVKAGGVDPMTARVREMRITASPDNPQQMMIVDVELIDAIISDIAGKPTARRNLQHIFTVPMPKSVIDLGKAGPRQFLDSPDQAGLISRDALERLRGAWVRQQNHVEAELHVRFSFALSCFVLVLVGAAIGMIFKSGNFVSAFAVSTAPAILTLILIMTGQQLSENIPERIAASGFVNSLDLGLFVVWSGNAVTLLLAAAFCWKLSRT